MYELLLYFGLGLFGLALGSFAGAQVWRLRARQLAEDKAAGEKVDKAEYNRLKQLSKTKVSEDRSQCLRCHHPLAWYDLVPLVSWLMLRGKCRYCHKSIGWFEPLMEIGMAAFFIVSYACWPYELETPLAIAQFGIWLLSGVGLAILLAYDAKWFLLPDTIMFPLIGLAAINALLYIIMAPNAVTAMLSVIGAWCALSGIYLTLYILSKGAWVGFGDVKLGAALAFLLVDWKIALLALFLANVIGTLIVLPGMLTKKLNRGSHVPFGPMLIGGWLVAGLFGKAILDWYLNGLLL